jgi:hypothetical protein
MGVWYLALSEGLQSAAAKAVFEQDGFIFLIPPGS